MPELLITRTLSAGPAAVWHAFTDAVALAAWFWPPSYQARVKSEPTADGVLRIESAVAGMAVGGHYLEASAPSRLVWTWRWEGEDDVTVVEIDLDSRETGTVLALRQSGFATESSRDDHIEGWNSCLDRLPGYLAG